MAKNLAQNAGKEAVEKLGWWRRASVSDFTPALSARHHCAVYGWADIRGSNR